MTQKTLSGLMLIVIVSLISYKAFSSVHTVKASLEINLNTGLTQEPVKGDLNTHNNPVFPAPESKESHGKIHAPQMDEVAHIHKFHKERVKKVKKHHGKLWLLSQIILFICHVSVLVIAFLHVTH